MKFGVAVKAGTIAIIILVFMVKDVVTKTVGNNVFTANILHLLTENRSFVIILSS